MWNHPSHHLESRDSSEHSKKKQKTDDSEMTECESSGSDSVNVGSVRRELGVSADLSASVCTIVRESDGKKNGDMNELSKMREIGERLRKVVFSEVNRASKGVREYVLNCASAHEERLIKLMYENERLRGRLAECHGRGMAPVQSASKTYAGVVATSANVKPNVRMSEQMFSMNERKYAEVIKPKDESERLTSDLNIRVKAMRKTRNGGIAVETVTAGEMKRMRECKKFDEIGMRVDELRKIGEKVIVFDIPCEMTSETLMNELYVCQEPE